MSEEDLSIVSPLKIQNEELENENQLINESYEDNKLKLDIEVNQRKILEELLAQLKQSENESKTKI